MLRSLLSGSLTMEGAIMEILAVVMIVFLILPLHEMAHGFVAYKLGDNTAKNMGRLRFNPMAHVDPIGALMILFVGFGWAKPVPVDPRNFKNPKAGMAITALAGPVSNLLAAFAAALLYNVAAIVATNVSLSAGAWELISIFFIYFISINISLAVFNLIPIPPLDGSKILFAFLPDRIVYKVYQNEQVLSIVLIVLIFTGVLTGPLSYLQNILTNWVFHLASLPFAAFW
ncbi:site-2 protease family protein [Oscillospiraceae bacterium LCP25S3_E10]|nr:site-2 protease family protein [Ruminococcus sp.]MDD6447024.1 site-2 protease family protein [Ruminococcus sp.]MDY2856471.1 site-2 protease family protein [Oscillospiraceae bacterium]